ncbi:MAG: Crossover junction endodeoxyribonuclease RuvC [Chlamydiae bacterium]|nr:Crossover junction endodeoxyribonuclease RuvC [Chlamydiota bacterium]
MRREKIILGIDPGTRCTGYGIISLHSTSMKPLDFGAIRPSPKATMGKRYLVIFNAIETLIESYKPEIIAVESQFVHKNVASAMKLGMARAMVILAAERRDIPLFEYTPKKAKLAVTGSGAASKEQVQKMVQLLLSLPELPYPEDAADALALALCHAHTIR